MGRQFIVVFVPPAVVIKLSYTVGKSQQELEAKLLKRTGSSMRRVEQSMLRRIAWIDVKLAFIAKTHQ